MRLGSLALLTIVLLVAGCASPPDAPVEPARDGNAPIDIRDDVPDASFGDVVTGPVAAPDLNATLERAPNLVVGEWWRVELSGVGGQKQSFVRVLADIEDDKYIFGMPHEGWWKEAVIFHTPAFGEVNRSDLSYNTHDKLFTPLKFPLADGASWKTSFSGGGELTANVKVESPTRATVAFTGAPGVMGQATGAGPATVLTLAYDATMHEVVEFQHPTVSFKVVEHGYDFQGWVTIPRAEKLVFFNGRLGPALDLNLQPAPPIDTLSVSGGYNRVSFILSAQVIGPAPGAFRVTATGNDGKTYAHEAIPGTGWTITFHEARDPDGDWNVEYVAAGAGAAFIEGIAYHQYDIRLPDGAIRADHSHEVIR